MTSFAKRPAILGGDPAFSPALPYARPTLPPFERVLPGLRQAYESGIVTCGETVCALEAAIARQTGAAHAVAVASCTSGLMILLRVLRLKGEIILPSMTFFATAHAAAWNGLEPVLVDCTPGRLTIDPALVTQAITPRTCAILAVHVFGNPCDAESLEAIAAEHTLPLLFDSAHALGSRYRGRPAGSLGLAEVFSLGPSKLVCAGEGGVVTTNDGALARGLRHARDYGNPGTYDPLFAGINARMSEFHAAIGLLSLEDLEHNIERREMLIAAYHERLAGVQGIGFQEVLPGNRSAHKDCILLIDEGAFGMPATTLQKALAAEGIDCRRYFDPPLHRQTLYRACRTVPARGLPVTDSVARAALCPPLYSHLRAAEVERVANAIGDIGTHAAAVRAVLGERERPPLRTERSALDESEPMPSHEAA